MNWDNMDYDEIARYIRNNGIYTGNMVDRLCEIIEADKRQLTEFEAEIEGLTEQVQDFRQWVTSLQGEISALT
jgi:phage host-nuclease inhibitor protein Gam